MPPQDANPTPSFGGFGLKPPHSSWTSSVYTRMDSPAPRRCSGKTNSGLPSAMSSRRQPSRACGASPTLTISTYSSDSDHGTAPSKNIHAICTSGPPAGGIVGVGVGVSAVGLVGVGTGGEVGVSERVAVWVGLGSGVAVAVGAGVRVAVGEGRGVGGAEGVAVGVAVGDGAAVCDGVGVGAVLMVGSAIGVGVGVGEAVGERNGSGLGVGVAVVVGSAVGKGSGRAVAVGVAGAEGVAAAGVPVGVGRAEVGVLVGWGSSGGPPQVVSNAPTQTTENTAGNVVRPARVTTSPRGGGRQVSPAEGPRRQSRPSSRRRPSARRAGRRVFPTTLR